MAQATLSSWEATHHLTHEEKLRGGFCDRADKPFVTVRACPLYNEGTVPGSIALRLPGLHGRLAESLHTVGELTDAVHVLRASLLCAYHAMVKIKDRKTDPRIAVMHVLDSLSQVKDHKYLNDIVKDFNIQRPELE